MIDLDVSNPSEAPVDLQNGIQNACTDGSQISISHGFDPLSIAQAELVVKVEPIIANEEVSNELISEPEYTIEKVDDMEIIIDNKVGLAKPFFATAGALIKRENDVISGNTAFDELVS